MIASEKEWRKSSWFLSVYFTGEKIQRRGDIGTNKWKKYPQAAGLGSCYRKEGKVHSAFSAARPPPGHLFMAPCTR